LDIYGKSERENNVEIAVSTNVLNDIFGLSSKLHILQKDSMRLNELFTLWALEHGQKVLTRLFDGENLRPEIILLVNGKNIGSLDGLDTEIHHGDQVAILTAVAGG
jgi:molybdopterin converting factor small subunit